ncbi:WecB/TagA/CpsF family glycosyltransferase [Leptolyngbya sp. CCNP1308]|uniref:WecB/TagA/CpsF family glycosyltransferase n=1 Tax=Leptolyngbya sp. CCNP1308 TaxID=3110255 RepID=UPI002B1ED414|nr:WecB/TagA/CpsF family glycosyltransferase [Leptolyngbya sp. CCNP1308]MEA5448622.1 WecB/TagA/CpsF family glycosyltransferase [Leptolyngbya sp. CCNP1308]
MINKGKHSVLGVNVHAVDLEYAVSKIVSAAENKQPCATSALAVHGVMTGFFDKIHRGRLNALDLIVPDGQPVRMALQWLYGHKLPNRIAGADLTTGVARAFAQKGLKVYLYGSKPDVLKDFAKGLRKEFPGLQIVGQEPSKFRRLTEQERLEVVSRIKASGADAVFVGLGCPRQEVWAYEYRELLGMPILAVGAVFDFFAGNLPRAPQFCQDYCLEWFYRLIQEPKRLWQRYLVLGPIYIANILMQGVGIKAFPPTMPDGSEKLESFG